jgi:hypothetical protein
MQSPPSRPSFSGLLVHHDPTFGFSVLVPDGWRRLELSGSHAGVFYVPDESDLLTGIAIEGIDLGTPVDAHDLPALRRGMLAGMRRLPGYRIESREAEAIGELLILEARLTFMDNGSVRKRWVRLLYRSRTQVRLVAQAASIDRFTYWEPMFFEAMRTVRFGAPI